jgi:arsenite methyltransferase
MTTVPDNVRGCCATAYESDAARMLLGDSFHPGGLELTRRLGTIMGLRSGLRVLDVASGKGVSAIFVAKEFGCEVVGVDFSAANVEEATRRAADAGLSGLVTFEQGEAESLAFPDATFDAVVCECAFCTFPDKAGVAREFARVVKKQAGSD